MLSALLAGSPLAMPGTACGARRHQAVMRCGLVVAARTPWHQAPSAMHGQFSIAWAGRALGPQRLQLASGPLVPGESGKTCQPCSASVSAIARLASRFVIGPGTFRVL